MQIRGTVTASVPAESNESAGPQVRRKFPRSGRLLRHADFERVYKQGRRHFSNSMTVFYLQRQPGSGTTPGLRVGYTVSRAMGGAVQRNWIRRRLREAVRLSRPWPGSSTDVVINPKKSAFKADFSELQNELRQAFVVIDRKLNVTRVDDSVRAGGAKREA
jgi:ribonuclease P protein component